jgi:hypothetical protein
MHIEESASDSAAQLPSSFLEFIRAVDLSDERLRSWVDNLDVSADTKAGLAWDSEGTE